MLFYSIIIPACLWNHCLIFDPWRKSTFVESVAALWQDTNSFSVISVRNWVRRWRVQGSAQTDPCLHQEPLRAPPLDHLCLQTSWGKNSSLRWQISSRCGLNLERLLPLFFQSMCWATLSSASVGFWLDLPCCSIGEKTMATRTTGSTVL